MNSLCVGGDGGSRMRDIDCLVPDFEIWAITLFLTQTWLMNEVINANVMNWIRFILLSLAKSNQIPTDTHFHLTDGM